MPKTDPIRVGRHVTIYPPKPGNSGLGGRSHRIVWRRPDGNRKTAWRQDLDEALEVANDVDRQLEAMPSADGELDTGKTIRDLAAWYMHPDSQDQPWSPSHEAKQRSILDVWILPAIGDKRCVDLTKGDCNAIVNRARRKGRSPDQVRAVGAALRRMVNVGIEHGYFPSGVDPMLGVKYTPRSSRQGQAATFVPLDRRPSTDAVEKLADKMAADDRFEPWWPTALRVAAYCGLRWGELVGLNADDVDLEQGIIRIVRQVTYVGTDPHRHLPKYEKVRETFIPGMLADGLTRAVKAAETAPPASVCPLECQERSLACPGGAGAVLFPAPLGGYWRPSTFHTRRFRKACKLASWPTDPDGSWLWSWHDLRHHFCTWALATPPDGLGLEVADVSHFAGHATPDFTFRRYVSTREGAVDRARQAAERYAAV